LGHSHNGVKSSSDFEGIQFHFAYLAGQPGLTPGPPATTTMIAACCMCTEQSRINLAESD